MYRQVIITNEALHDIIDIEIYILCQFGDNRQQKFHNQIFNEISGLSLSAFAILTILADPKNYTYPD